MLETFGVYVRNIPDARLEEFLAKINTYRKNVLKIYTMGRNGLL